MAVLRAAVWLPYGARLALGRTFGRAMHAALASKRRIAHINLKLCLPELDEARRDTLVREHFANLGVGVLEAGPAWWARTDQLPPLAEVRGLEYLDAALARGKGVLLLTAHFTSLEIGGRLLLTQRPFAALYRHQSNALFNEFMVRQRTEHCARAIHRDDVRAILRALKDHLPVWYAPDQNYAGHFQVFAPFFGIPAATNGATARLARSSGAAVVPYFPERLPGRQGYRLVIQPALADFPSGDAEADAARINAVIEQQVRRLPAQYLWIHRRFKTRPEGGANPYA